jgi:AcrR family transcriptional regulator
MPSPLEKARQDPSSMKARILASARRVFGEHGYKSTTTRMIAKDVGIDISTLYYHWGEKRDLYEALMVVISEEIQDQFELVERRVKGRSLAARLEISIEVICDYLFAHPEVANLILFSYLSKAHQGTTLELKVAEYVSNIAVAMDLAMDRHSISLQAKARVMAVWNLVLNFIAGEDFFRPMLEVSREHYMRLVKETLKLTLIQAFAGKG